MKRFLIKTAAFLFLPIIGLAVLMLLLQGRGVSAKPDPPALEARGALLLRSWMTPSTYKVLKNQVSATEENFIAAREHYADHCASCHANDGSGNTEMGRNLYPKSPDMRLPRTQQLSDGELFYFIENGVRMTGMPAWSTGTPEGEKSSWQLVHFIRRLPTLTPEDFAVMERFNPTSRAQFEEERKVEQFLKGTDVAPPAPDAHAGHKQP
jgi:mono/diheme cytochrome c family protein